MLKRVNKITALLMAAASVISMTPTMAAERLDAKEGSIQNAVAFKDGKYIYDGYKDQNESGLYFNDGTNEKLLDDVSEIDTEPKFGDDYVSALDGSDEYTVNLSDGTVSDEDTKESLESDAEVKLKTKLKNTLRYGSDTEIKSFNRVSDGQFGDNWYSYTSIGNLAKYDDILGVPENLAAGLNFTDEDEAEGKIVGTVSITKAENESDIDSYRVYYLDNNNLKVGDAIGTVEKEASSLQVVIADTDIPSGATQLGVYSVNSKGESEAPTKITLVDTGATVVTYKAQIKIELTAFYYDVVINGVTFSPSWGSNLPDALVQSVNNTTFDNYTVISAVSEHAYNSDGSVDNNNGKVTITLGTNQELSSVPTDFVTFNGSSTDYALSVELISDYAVPSNLAEGLTFTDEDEDEGKISGTVSITNATDESDVDSYRVYYLDNNDAKVGDAVGTVDKGTSPLQVVIDDTDIPLGATKFGVYSVNKNGESISATTTTLVDAGPDSTDDSNNSNPRNQVQVYAFYGSITIADQTFNQNIDWNITSKARAEAVKEEIEDASFEDYTVESVSVTGTDGSPTLTVILKAKEAGDTSLPTLKFDGNDVDWQMNVSVITDTLAVSENLAEGLTFTDEDITTGKISGTVSITKATDESDIDSYKVYYLDDNNAKVGDAVGTVDKATSPLQVVIADTDIPSGVTQLGVYSVNENGESETATKTALVDDSGTTGVETNAEAKTRLTVTIAGFWGNFTVAGVEFTVAYNGPGYTMSTTADDLVSQFNSALFTGYTLESATADNGTINAIFTTTEELTEEPSGFTTGFNNVVGSVTVEPITTITTTGEAVTVDASEDTSFDQTTSAAVSFEPVLASADTSDKVVYYGYTDDEGNYIDCSKIANLSIYNGERIVKIDNFNDEVTKGGKTVKVGLPTLVETLGQDKDYIYTIISVQVVGSQNVNGTVVSDTTKETLYYVQKISKVEGSKEYGAYLPSKVESYQINNDADWDGGENWSYMAAYNMLVGDDSSRKIKIVDGNIYVAHDDGAEVTVGKLKLGKTKRITPVNSTVTSSEVTQSLVYEDTANSTEMSTWTMDANGNIWAIYEGKIKKSAQANEFQDIYRCDKEINNFDVYDDDNLIGWSDDEDIYITAREGIVETAVMKTGWQKLDDGTWNLYDLTGNPVRGWVMFGSGWYYMNDQGVMQTGWVNYSEKWYYLADSGFMKTGWIKVDEKWYYLDKAGERQENTTVDGYSIDSNGVWIQ